MTAFWISTGLLTLLVLAVLCWPLLRRHGGAGASRKAINTAIYRDQLAELERDLASGVLSQADYGSARDELERRVLEDVVIGLGLVERSGTDELLLMQILQPVIVSLGVDVLRGCPCSHFAGFACIDAQQEVAFANRLTDIHLHVDHPTGDLRGQGRLRHCLDGGLKRQGQINRMPLCDHRGQIVGPCNTARNQCGEQNQMKS